jgi:hypothetical protein
VTRKITARVGNRARLGICASRSVVELSLNIKTKHAVKCAQLFRMHISARLTVFEERYTRVSAMVLPMVLRILCVVECSGVG